MTSTITRVDTDIRIPFDRDALSSSDPTEQARAILDIIKVLQGLLEQLVTVTNLNVDGFDGEALYLGLKDETGDYPNGTWRLIIISEALEIQKKISGTWTKIAKHNN